jgi:hypothetical protein
LSVVNGERPMIPEIGEQEGALADAARRGAHDVLAPGAAGRDERDHLSGETADRLCPEHHPWFVDTVRASAPGR